jgi:probable HAF family extracellular repeat protein
MKRHVFAAAFGALLVVLPVSRALRADSALYTIEDLGLMGDFAPTVTGMNASGQVSGYVIGVSGLPRAVLYTNGRGWEDLPGVGTFYSVATGINDNGDVVGYHHNGLGIRAFRYSPGPGLTSIEPLPGGMMTMGRAIDAAGNVVGQNLTDTGSTAFRAAPGLPATALPTLGGQTAIACGINDAGQIVGSGANASGMEHAFRVEADNSMTVLVPFDGASGMSTACAIDAAGRVGGRATSGGIFRAFRFVSGAPVNVDTFASSMSNIEAMAAGVAVGWFISEADGSTHAVVNTEAGSADLNDLVTPGTGWNLDQAFAVNADGSIAGNGRLNGQPRPFRLTRVPEARDTTAPTITALSATPSTIAPPNGELVPVTLAVSATDEVDPAPSCSLSSIGGTSLSPDDHEITGPLSARVRALGGRTYTLTVTCSDAAGNQASSAVPVYVPPDATAPVIAGVVATPGSIWPPNGKMVAVSVSVTATDDVDATPQCSLHSVLSNGSSESNDAVVTGQFSADVRAEKNGDGSLRTYTLKVACRDAAGNKSWGSATVVVTKDNPSVQRALEHQLVMARTSVKALVRGGR